MHKIHHLWKFATCGTRASRRKGCRSEADDSPRTQQPTSLPSGGLFEFLICGIQKTGKKRKNTVEMSTVITSGDNLGSCLRKSLLFRHKIDFITKLSYCSRAGVGSAPNSKVNHFIERYSLEETSCAIECNRINMNVFLIDLLWTFLSQQIFIHWTVWRIE